MWILEVASIAVCAETLAEPDKVNAYSFTDQLKNTPLEYRL